MYFLARSKGRIERVQKPNPACGLCIPAIHSPNWVLLQNIFGITFAPLYLQLHIATSHMGPTFVKTVVDNWTCLAIKAWYINKITIILVSQRPDQTSSLEVGYHDHLHHDKMNILTNRTSGSRSYDARVWISSRAVIAHFGSFLNLVRRKCREPLTHPDEK